VAGENPNRGGGVRIDLSGGANFGAGFGVPDLSHWGYPQPAFFALIITGLLLLALVVLARAALR
jgi:hypothetical protein